MIDFSFDKIKNNFIKKLIIYFLFIKKETRDKYFKLISKGTEREVWTDKDHKIVIKKLYYSNDNRNQNKNEYILYKRAKSLCTKEFDLLCPLIKIFNINIMPVCNLFANDYEYNHDIVTKEEINFVKRFENLRGLTLPLNNIKWACGVTGFSFKEFITLMVKLREKTDIDLEDLYLRNLGIYKNKLVIIDYGLIGK